MKKITGIKIGPGGSAYPTYEEDMRESEQEDFGPNSKTKEENDKDNLYPSEYHPRCPELKGLTPEDNEKFKETWYDWLSNRKTD